MYVTATAIAMMVSAIQGAALIIFLYELNFKIVSYSVLYHVSRCYVRSPIHKYPHLVVACSATAKEKDGWQKAYHGINGMSMSESVETVLSTEMLSPCGELMFTVPVPTTQPDR